MDNNSYSIMLAKIQAHRQTEDIIKGALDPFNVTSREWLCLGSLRNHCNNASPGVIAKELHVSPPLITRLTKSLQKKGLIKILQPQDDKRRRYLELTSEGSDVLQRSEPIVRQTLKNWLAPINSEHVDIYINVLLQVAYKL